MKLFSRRKNSDSRVRRYSRLQWLRLRKISLYTTLFALVGTSLFTGYHNGSFKKVGDWASARALAYSANAGFKVTDILVTGRVHIPAPELLARFSIKQGMPIFGVSIVDAQQSLSGISWVKEVSVSRRLPGTIAVELIERTPVALWQYKKKISVIDQEGVALTSENLGVWENLPLVVGEDAAKHMGELLDLLKAEPVVADALASAVRVEGRRWDLHLKTGITVKLPEQDIELALSQLARFEEKKKIFSRAIASIDLRQPEKMMVTPIASNDNTAADKNKKANI